MLRRSIGLRAKGSYLQYKIQLYRVGYVAVLLVAGLLIGTSFASTRVNASYLDNEVKYQGLVPNSLSLDLRDGTADGVCHEFNPDPEVVTPETSCQLSGDDQYSAATSIGFPFQFYGHAVSDVYLSTNGVIQFSCPSREYANEPLPTMFGDDCNDTSDELRPAAVFAFWDDVITSPKAIECAYANPDNPDECVQWTWDGNYPTVMYKTIGTPSSRKFIVQWTNMYLYQDPRVPVGTFQAIFYEGSNDIQLQYRNLLGDPARSAGSSATVGLQYNLENYSQYLFNDEELTPDSKTVHEGMAIRYTPNGDGGYAVADDQAAYDPVYLTNEEFPGTPTLQSPADGAAAVLRRPNLHWSSTSATTSYTVTISPNANMSNAVANVTGLTDTQYNSTITLAPNTDYYWMVRSVNDVGETFSDIHTFRTGTRITTAGIVPNDGDANNDGIEDAGQTNVTGLISPVNNHYIAVHVDDCTIQSATGLAEPTDEYKDQEYNYSAGLVNFTANCGDPGYAATVKIYYYDTTEPNSLLRKYNVTTHAYSDIDGATIEQTTIDGHPVVVATYQVTDGGLLDQDGTADATIIDPVGLASLPTQQSARTGSTNLASTGEPARKALMFSLTIIETSIAVLLVCLQKRTSNSVR